MLVGIISDVHADVEGLELVLDYLEGCAIKVCTGDIHGKRSRPGNEVDECIALLRRYNVWCTKGNHDFQAERRHGSVYEDEGEYFFRTMPVILQGGRIHPKLSDVLFTHSRPSEFSDFDYFWSESDVSRYLASIDERIVFVGHSHRAKVIQYNGTVQVFPPIPIDPLAPIELESQRDVFVQLEKGSRYIVDCSSIYGPRDGKQSSFVVYDTKNQTIRIKRFMKAESLCEG